MNSLRITLVKSPIGVSEKLRKVLVGLGLRKTNHSVIRKNSPEIQGMIFKVKHLVRVSGVEEGT
jgi:large subunit ribosomal protein L30